MEASMSKVIDFRTDPSNYHHWRLDYEGPVAWLTMDVDENAGLFDNYLLKLNSYDLGVDIELNDIVQRMRFEHPEVKVVVMRSGKDKVFARAQIFACWAEQAIATKSISANLPTKPATALRPQKKTVVRNILPQ